MITGDFCVPTSARMNFIAARFTMSMEILSPNTKGSSFSQSFALTDCEKLDPFVFGDKISIDIVNLAAMKFILAEVGTQKSPVIIARDKADLLAVDLVRNF